MAEEQLHEVFDKRHSLIIGSTDGSDHEWDPVRRNSNSSYRPPLVNMIITEICPGDDNIQITRGPCQRATLDVLIVRLGHIFGDLQHVLQLVEVTGTEHYLRVAYKRTDESFELNPGDIWFMLHDGTSIEQLPQEESQETDLTEKLESKPPPIEIRWCSLGPSLFGWEHTVEGLETLQVLQAVGQMIDQFEEAFCLVDFVLLGHSLSVVCTTDLAQESFKIVVGEQLSTWKHLESSTTTVV